MLFYYSRVQREEDPLRRAAICGSPQFTPGLPAGAGAIAVILLANVSDLAAILASTDNRRFPVWSRVAARRS